MNNLERITDGLQQGYYRNNPKWCADDLSILAGEYSWICGQLEDILSRKSKVWNVLRGQTQSDKSADKQWDATEDGVNEMGLRLRMKSIEKMMSALKSLLRVAEGEAMNNH